MEDSCDNEYVNLLRLIFPPDSYQTVYDRLLHFQWKNTKHHKESFRAHCIVTGHLMEQFCREKNILQDTWNGITYARLVGFLHDIGKPFVLRNSKHGYQYFTGHAQVGARLFYLRFQHEIPESILLRMAIAIDSHMCSLRSDKISAVDTLRINAVMHMYFPSLDVIPVLECLHRADAMGKKPAITDDNPAYQLESPIPYHKDDKIVIFLIGPSGSGKSTLAATLKAQLSAYGSVDHLERDSILMEFALEGETYKACRQRVYDDPLLKKDFQLRWIQRLHSADSKILLIDTLQNFYHLDAQYYYHHFRIGLYCVPMNFIDNNLCGKAPNIEFPPQKWIGYPTVLTELKETYCQLEVGTGIWQVIPTLVKRYLDQFVPEPLEQQPTIASLWNKYSGQEAIVAQYNVKGITFSPQYTFGGDNEIIRVSYLALSDVIYGPTRYYRGEYLLKTGEGISMLRSGFPTFRKKMDIIQDFDKIVVTPKYDGILVNILYVPKEYKHYDLLKSQFPDEFYPNIGLLFVGSKQTLIMDVSLKKRFKKVIETSFETFISSYAHYFKDKLTTLHFEMMMEESSEELTVYYTENFCKFLGCTIFNDKERLFQLPKLSDLRAVEQKEFDNFLECEKYIEEQHQKMLQGDAFTEPEGFVLYVHKNGLLKDIIKRKFVEYLAVHKPKHHPEVYKEILENTELRNRFQKCRMIKDIGCALNTLIQDLDQELTENMHSDRKTFALYLKQNKAKFDEFQRKMNEFTKELRVGFIILQKVFWKHYPNKCLMMQEISEPMKHILKK